MNSNKRVGKMRRDGERRMGNPRPVSGALCGRPTKDGMPCQRPLQWFEDACSVHATPAEQDAALRRLRAAQR